MNSLVCWFLYSNVCTINTNVITLNQYRGSPEAVSLTSACITHLNLYHSPEPVSLTWLLMGCCFGSNKICFFFKTLLTITPPLWIPLSQANLMSNAITFPFLVLEYTVLIFIIIPFSKFESKVSDHRGLHLCKLEIWLLVLKKLFLKKIYLISNFNLLSQNP